MSFTRLFDIPAHQQQTHPQSVALAIRDGEGDWQTVSTDDLLRRMDQVSTGLLRAGIAPGDRITIISENRPEWQFLDLGLQQIGAVGVPVFPKIGRENCAHVLREAEVRLVCVSGDELLELVASIRDEVPSLENVLAFDELESAPHWTELVADEPTAAELETVGERRDAIAADDLATIIYTSGTSGRPKGVMLSHRNVVSNVEACLEILPVDHRHAAVSFLPLNHIFERMINYLYLAAGVSIHYAAGPDELGDRLREVRPQLFSTVPRVLEKVHEKLVSAGRARPLLQRGIFFAALSLAERYETAGDGPHWRLLRRLLDPLVYRKWRDALGGELFGVVSGGSALNPRFARIFTAAGIPILEGYGLTETSPVIAVNRYAEDGRRLGTVGRPAPGVEVRIAADGEILCRGPNVMQGYHARDEATREVIDAEGWFHTGDAGHIDADGFLHVEGRQDTVFKTSGGKKVAPEPIEQKLQESFLIDHAMVCCEQQRMVTVLIAPDLANLETWCREHGVAWEGAEDAVRRPEVKDRFQRIIDRANRGLDHTMQIKRLGVVAAEWTVDGGELTPTMKLKRDAIRERYADRIAEMYESE